jgi:hypothetical protein
MAGFPDDSFQRLHGESLIMFYEGEYDKGQESAASVRRFTVEPALRTFFWAPPPLSALFINWID